MSEAQTAEALPRLLEGFAYHPLQGFMQSLLSLDEEALSAVEPYERYGMLHEQCDKPLTAFTDWLTNVLPDFQANGALTDELCGRVQIAHSNGHVVITHGITGIKAAGKDESEARARLRDMVGSQMRIWTESSVGQSLTDLAGIFKKQLIDETYNRWTE